MNMKLFFKPLSLLILQ
jgi:hypothetical protein